MRKVRSPLGGIQFDLIPGLHAVPQGKALCDKDGLARGKIGSGFAAGLHG